MANIIYQYIIPNLLFFIFIFLIFSLTQASIVLFLEWLEYRNDEKLMFLALKSYKYYKKIKFAFNLIAALLIFSVILIIVPYIQSISIRPEITIFAVFMLAVITLVYFILTNLKGEFIIKKRIDKIIYIVLSLILYVFIIVMINQKLPNYRIYVYDDVVKPIVSGISNQLNADQKKKLLIQLHEMVKNNQCPFKNYKNEKNTGVVHNLFYVATDTDLKTKKSPMLPNNDDMKTRGKVCMNGKDIYILTDYGEWYLLIDTKK